jgi:hypothetical protein
MWLHATRGTPQHEGTGGDDLLNRMDASLRQDKAVLRLHARAHMHPPHRLQHLIAMKW